MTSDSCLEREKEEEIQKKKRSMGVQWRKSIMIMGNDMLRDLLELKMNVKRKDDAHLKLG